MSTRPTTQCPLFRAKAVEVVLNMLCQISVADQAKLLASEIQSKVEGATQLAANPQQAQEMAMRQAQQLQMEAETIYPTPTAEQVEGMLTSPAFESACVCIGEGCEWSEAIILSGGRLNGYTCRRLQHGQ